MLKKKVIGKVPTGISSMSDVELTDLQDSQILKYNESTGMWVNAGEGGGGGGSINDAFSDVKVGDDHIYASGADTIEFEAGNAGITITADSSNKKITITNSGGEGLTLGETAGTAYEGSKGKDLADNCVRKSQTAGLLKNNGTVDTTQYQSKLTTQTAYRDAGSQSQVPMITTNDLGQVTSISLTPINIGQNGKADKVADATENNFAALDNTGNLIDSGISKFIIQSLQSQINDIYAQLVGVSATAVGRSAVVAGHAAPTIDINITTTESMDGVVVFRILNPGTASEARTSIYSSSSAGTSWSCTDGDSLHTFTAPSTTGNTIAYQVIATRSEVEKAITVYVEVVEDRVVSLAWSGGSISSPTVEVGGTATITKGTVTATYLSGDTSNVTNSATFRSVSGKGTILGTTYTGVTAGADTISCSYGGVTAATTLSVTVTASRLNVQFGVGTTYQNAVWTTLPSSVTNNLEVNGISNAQGDYLFVKYDKRDTVSNLWINAEIPSQIDLAVAIEDGDYKYRRTQSSLLASRSPIDYLINKTNG